MKDWLPSVVLLFACGLLWLAQQFCMPLVDFLSDWSPLGILMFGIDHIVGADRWEALGRAIHGESWRMWGMCWPYVFGSASAECGVFLLPYLCAGMVARKRSWIAVIAGSFAICAFLVIGDDSTWWVLNALAFFVALPFLLALFVVGRKVPTWFSRKSNPEVSPAL